MHLRISERRFVGAPVVSRDTPRRHRRCQGVRPVACCPATRLVASVMEEPPPLARSNRVYIAGDVHLGILRYCFREGDVDRLVFVQDAVELNGKVARTRWSNNLRV
jgi:hypothetical protein